MWQKINVSTKNLLGVINEILDISKIEAGKFTLEKSDFSLQVLLDDLTGLLGHRCQSKNIELLIYKLDDVPEFIVGDALRLNQVLMNLIGNAIKFTSKGMVNVVVSKLREDEMNVKLRFEVSDTGIGMTKEQISRLFQAFNQADVSTSRKFGGTGLGLTISKELVTLMDGELGVTSRIDKGSTFVFELDFEKSAMVHYQPEDLESLLNIKVLIVDDNVISGEVFKNYLATITSHVSFVGSGEEALNLCRENDYDLIILDLVMEGMDGIDTWRAISRIYQQENLPKVILATVYNRDSILQSALEVGIKEVITKPIPRSTMYNSVCNVYNKMVRPSNKFMNNELPKGFDSIRGSRILVVDDNDINREVINDILSKEGFKVEEAVDGNEAIVKVQESDIDLVLMDLHMPGKDGLESTIEIRSLGYSDIPIIALSADVVGNITSKVKEAGMNDYLTKPINRIALWECLSEWLKPNHTEEEQKVQYQIAENESNEKDDEALQKTIAEKMSSLMVEEGLERVGNDLDVYLKVLNKFYKQISESVNSIGQSMDSRDYDALGYTCHYLRGASENIGAALSVNPLAKLRSCQKVR